jgi:hypothetical protein
MFKKSGFSLLFALFFIAASTVWAGPPPWSGKAAKSGDDFYGYGDFKKEPKAFKGPRSVKPGNGVGYIKTTRNVYHPGDVLEVRVVFPRSLDALWPEEGESAEAQAHIVIQSPEGEFTTFSLFDSETAPEDPAPVDDGTVSENPAPTEEGTDPEDSVTTEGETAPEVPVVVDGEIEPEVPIVFVNVELDPEAYPTGDYLVSLILTFPAGNPLLVQDWYNGFRGQLGITRVKIVDTEDDDCEEGWEGEDVDDDGIIDGDTDGDGFADGETPEPPEAL